MAIVPHTPGPWRVPLDEPYDGARPTYFLEDSAGHQLMLLARLPEAGPQENEANARLVAAAPDLLAALERIVAINGSTGGHKAMVAEFKYIAQVAIAKAKGGAS